MKNSLKWLAYSTSIIPVLLVGCVSAKSKRAAGSDPLASSRIEAISSSREFVFSQDSSEGIVLPASFNESMLSEEPNAAQVPPDTVVETGVVPINLPSALAMVGGQHPVVGLAQWRVREAYAQLERAQVMWLPSIQPGINFRRRDGNYQAVGGEIVDVNLNSINYGLGSGAVAAGSPAVPGIMARFHLADAIFLPKVNEKTAWARGHAATATLNQQLLTGALAYCDLLEAYQATEVLRESFHRTEELTKITTEYATAGQGLQSDAERSKTELSLLRLRLLTAQEQQYVASSRLARALSVPMTTKFVPQDVVVLPIEFLQAESDEGELIAQGLVRRPELKESQALVAAAYEAHKREKYAPFVPSVLLGFSATSFGGGLGSHAENFAGRYDMDAMMVWETRNLGLGEGAARRERHAQIQQATFDKLRIIDQVAQEIAEAKTQVVIRKQQMTITQEAIQSAQKSYDLNVERIRQGQGLPIEVLQAIQALEASQRSYVKAVVDYNRAQFQLQWALGWQVDSWGMQSPANSAVTQ
jgi:outer membrane protein TolC